jgi:hypothetical protein
LRVIVRCCSASQIDSKKRWRGIRKRQDPGKPPASTFVFLLKTSVRCRLKVKVIFPAKIEFASGTCESKLMRDNRQAASVLESDKIIRSMSHVRRDSPSWLFGLGTHRLPGNKHLPVSIVLMRKHACVSPLANEGRPSIRRGQFSGTLYSPSKNRSSLQKTAIPEASFFLDERLCRSLDQFPSTSQHGPAHRSCP